MCGINQLSPGAYLLRGDLFPSIISVSVYCFLLLLGLTMDTSDNQGTGDWEIHIRSAALASTLVQLSQVRRGKAQPVSPSHRRNHGRRGTAQSLLGYRVHSSDNCRVRHLP